MNLIHGAAAYPVIDRCHVPMVHYAHSRSVFREIFERVCVGLWSWKESREKQRETIVKTFLRPLVTEAICNEGNASE